MAAPEPESVPEPSKPAPEESALPQAQPQAESVSEMPPTSTDLDIVDFVYELEGEPRVAPAFEVARMMEGVGQLIIEGNRSTSESASHLLAI
jgi:hypothetical protein